MSVRRGRSSGEVVLRFRDDQERIIEVRLRPRQFTSLANEVLGLAEAMGEE
jgi:hypothetical protein